MSSNIDEEVVDYNESSDHGSDAEVTKSLDPESSENQLDEPKGTVEDTPMEDGELEDKPATKESTESTTQQSGDDRWGSWEEEDAALTAKRREQTAALENQIPGYRPHEMPWTIMNGVFELSNENDMQPVNWMQMFLRWRTIRRKRAVERDNHKALQASWSTFYTRAVMEGREGVEKLIASAEKRAAHDAQYSVTGIKRDIHDLCMNRKIACHVLLHENACPVCGYKDRNDPEFTMQWRWDTNDEAFANKLRQYRSVLSGTDVNWQRNFDENIHAGRPERLATTSSGVPMSHAPASSRASARGNTSRVSPSPFADPGLYDPHVRGSNQRSNDVARRNREPAAGEREQTYSFDDDCAAEEQRDFALMNYDPEEKFRRHAAAVSGVIQRLEKQVASLSECVGAFAATCKQVTTRCDRIEKQFGLRVSAIDAVLKTQHLSLQELEKWHREQRAAAVKRAREEKNEASKRAREAAAETAVPLGRMQTHKQNASLDRPPTPGRK